MSPRVRQTHQAPQAPAGRSGHATPALRSAVELATDPEVSPEVLVALTAASEDFNVRWRLADNPRTPPVALAVLARSTRPEIMWRVAKHPATPLDALARLARRPPWDVRVEIAQHPAATPATLGVMVSRPTLGGADLDETVVSAIVRRLEAWADAGVRWPAEDFAELLTADSPRIRLAAIRALGSETPAGRAPRSARDGAGLPTGLPIAG